MDGLKAVPFKARLNQSFPSLDYSLILLAKEERML
jgi:hypothetical protein